MTRPAPDELQQRLTTELDRRASAVSVADQAFDPRRAPRWEDLLEPEAQRSRHRLVWTAVGVAAATVLLIAGLQFGRQPSAVDLGTRPPVGTGTTPSVPLPPNGRPTRLIAGPTATVVAGQVPEGYQLWGLNTSTTGPLPTEQRLSRNGEDPWLAGTAHVAITISSHADRRPGQDHAAGGTLPAPGRPGRRLPLGGWEWDEDTATIQVSATGVDEATLAGVIEGLVWRQPGEPLGGFDPGSGDWRVTSEIRGSREPGASSRAVYGRADGARLSVVTETNHRHDRLRLDRGTVRRGDGSLTGTNPLGAAFVAWDDGRSVTVTTESPGTTPAPAPVRLVDRIAGTLVPADVPRQRELRAEASANLATEPVLAAVDTPAGRATVAHLPGRADPFKPGTPLRALCLTAPGEPTACALDEAGLDKVYAGLVIGERWHAVLVTPPGVGELRFTETYGSLRGGENGGTEYVDWTAPPGESGAGDGWTAKVSVVTEPLMFSIVVKRASAEPPAVEHRPLL